MKENDHPPRPSGGLPRWRVTVALVAAGVASLWCTAATAQSSSAPPTDSHTPYVGWTQGHDVTFMLRPNLGFGVGGYAQLIARSISDSAGSHVGEIYFQRLRPRLRGVLGVPWLTFQVAGEFGSGTPSGDTKPVLPIVPAPVFAPRPYLLDAFVAAQPRPEIGLRVGQYKTPFAHAFMITVQDTAFTDYSLVTRAFIPNRDIGGDLRGTLLHGALSYNVGVYNGGGRLDQLANNYNANGYDFSHYTYHGYLLMAHIESEPLAPLGEDETDFTGGPLRLHFGANIAYSQRNYTPGMAPSGLPAAFDDTIAGAEFALKVRGLSFYTEGYLRERDPATGGNTTTTGFFAHAGYSFFQHRFELATRYSFMRPQLEQSTLNMDREIFEVVFNVFLNQNYLKVAGQYRFDSHVIGNERVNSNEFVLFVQATI